MPHQEKIPNFFANFFLVYDKKKSMLKKLWIYYYYYYEKYFILIIFILNMVYQFLKAYFVIGVCLDIYTWILKNLNETIINGDNNIDINDFLIFSFLQFCNLLQNHW
jgi:hypothetical protein